MLYPLTAVVARTRALGTHQSEVLDILGREARYFEKHAKQMQYKKFREKKTKKRRHEDEKLAISKKTW